MICIIQKFSCRVLGWFLMALYNSKVQFIIERKSIKTFGMIFKTFKYLEVVVVIYMMLEKINKKTACIGIIGLGYVGLPTAIAFAEAGFKVIGADKNPAIVDGINKGICHLKDLNIEDRLKPLVKNSKLSATTNTQWMTILSDIVLIIVPTPLHPDKTPDLSAILSACKDIVGSNSIDNKLIILESTVYPGTTEELIKPILDKISTCYGIAHVPERYNPGDKTHKISDVTRVIGAITPEWANACKVLYSHIVKNTYIAPDIKTAEASKIIENVQRDLNIALMNELALIFERMNIDIVEVIKASATKWNFNVYYPGAGVGGHCLPVDPIYLIHKADELGYHSKIISAGRSVNDYMPTHIFNLLIKSLNDHERPINSSNIVILGASYKENIGDTRESPTIQLINNLKEYHARIHVIDPYVMDNLEQTYNVTNDADAIILMVSHDQFKVINFTAIKKHMRTPIIIDGRRLYNQKELENIGFTYRSVGGKNYE